MMTLNLLRHRLAVLVVWISLLSCSGWCIAQNYRFSVPEMDLQVYIQPDASARLEYRILFENSPQGHAIDIVDVGLPHRNYDMSTMKASIDGVPIQSIQKSTYIDVGVEVHLGSRSIAPGRRGEFRFQCEMPDMVYRDTTDKSFASLQVIPTWFDETVYTDRTLLQAAIHFPPGTDETQIKYQNENFKYTDLALYGDGDQRHPVALWQYDQWRLSSSNPKLSVSFPGKVMQRVVSIGPFGMFMRWFSENPQVYFTSLALLGILFAVIFFRFSHGTGFVLFFLLAGIIGIVAFSSSALHLLAWPALVGLFFLNEKALKQKSEKRSYLPAMATVEGGGIKRGLTAAQAAVLLEMPMGKVLSLVIFGLMKKNVVEKVADSPLSVQVADGFTQPRQNRLQLASDQGIVLHDYEHAFVDRLHQHRGPVHECSLSEPMGGLIQSVANRMAGFDLQDTKEYYQAIIERAWKEAETIGEVQQRDEAVDRNFEWILMDEHWADMFDKWARSGRPYQPRWDRRRPGPVIIIDQDPGGWSPGGSIPPSSTPRPSTPETARPSLGEVAAGFAGWTENTMASLASAVEPMKMGLDIPKGAGILDLSGIDRVTGDVFQALAEAAASNKGRSGGGGGCACACAGCACACACAGGGR